MRPTAAADALASAFLRTFDGFTTSFGIFEQVLLEQDLMTSGTHYDADSAVVAFDAADAYAPGIGFPTT